MLAWTAYDQGPHQDEHRLLATGYTDSNGIAKLSGVVVPLVVVECSKAGYIGSANVAERRNSRLELSLYERSWSPMAHCERDEPTQVLPEPGKD